MNTSYFITSLTITDPATSQPIEIAIYRHASGGLFGIDASFLTNGGDFETVDPSDDFSDPLIFDPFRNCTGYYDGLKTRLTESGRRASISPKRT